MKQLFLLLLLVFFAIGASAQTSRNSGGFPTVEAYVASIQSAANRNSDSSERLQHLLKNANDALYVTSAGVNTYGDNPVTLYADARSVARAANPGVSTNGIELATIRIKNAADLNSSIDLSAISSYPNLKYVYILCTTRASAQAINNIVKNVPQNVVVFYKIDSGS